MSGIPSTATRREIIVLVPGLWLLGSSLVLQGRRLRRQGYDVHLISYPTVRQSLFENASHINRVAAAIPGDTVHFVGHSLGGIVIRSLFHYFPEQRPGRIVTIGSPHGGSHVGGLISRSSIGRMILGQSVDEVLAGIPRAWPVPARDVGVIRGDRPIGLGRLFPGLLTPNDGLLTVAETSLDGATDELTLPVAHTGMLFSPRVATAIGRFLRSGRFAD